MPGWAPGRIYTYIFIHNIYRYTNVIYPCTCRFIIIREPALCMHMCARAYKRCNNHKTAFSTKKVKSRLAKFQLGITYES